MLSWILILSVAFPFLASADENTTGYTAVAPPPAVTAPLDLPLSVPENRWAPLNQLADDDLQDQLEGRLRGNDVWQRLIEEGRLAVGVVDLRGLDRIRFAAVNGDVMFYAASLPKIAALLTAHEKLEDGTLLETHELNRDLVDMIRVSSNRAATRVIDAVGFDAIRATVTNPRYRFYDGSLGGGIWLGKRYQSAGPRYPDPVAGYSHAEPSGQNHAMRLYGPRGSLLSSVTSSLNEIGARATGLRGPGRHRETIRRARRRGYAVDDPCMSNS